MIAPLVLGIGTNGMDAGHIVGHRISEYTLALNAAGEAELIPHRVEHPLDADDLAIIEREEFLRQCVACDVAVREAVPGHNKTAAQKAQAERAAGIVRRFPRRKPKSSPL